MNSQPPDEGEQNAEGFARVTFDEMFLEAPLEVMGMVDVIRRTGAYSLQIRENDDPAPTVWVVVAEHYVDEDGMPTHVTEGTTYHVTGVGGLSPGQALARMVCELMDGGLCVYCDRPTGFIEPYDEIPDGSSPLCWTYWSAKHQVYIRSCQDVPEDDDADS